MLGWVERKESHGSWAALIPDGIKIVRCRRLQFFYVELGYVRIGFFFQIDYAIIEDELIMLLQELRL